MKPRTRWTAGAAAAMHWTFGRMVLEQRRRELTEAGDGDVGVAVAAGAAVRPAEGEVVARTGAPAGVGAEAVAGAGDGAVAGGVAATRTQPLAIGLSAPHRRSS